MGNGKRTLREFYTADFYNYCLDFSLLDLCQLFEEDFFYVFMVPLAFQSTVSSCKVNILTKS